MWYYVTKVGVTAILVVAISEAAKRSSLLGGILASIPLVSVLAMIWLYHDNHDIPKIAALASSISWLVIPSLALFVSLPWLLKAGLGFYPSLLIAILATVLAYYLMVTALRGFGISP